MSESCVYRDYDVAHNLQFKTADIVRMGGLTCSARMETAALDGLFTPPNRITKASVRLSFTLAGAEILVRGTVQGQREVSCARCLKVVKQPFTEDFLETYSQKQEIIDIMYLVRQTLALTEEIRFLCTPDCKGLCPQCGQDLNTAPCGCQPENLSPFAMLKGKFK